MTQESTESLVRVVGIDPGVTTGIAIHEVLPGGVNPIWRREELGPDKHHLDLYRLFTNVMPTIVVCEAFEYRIIRAAGKTDMPGIRLESREYIGICELYCQQNDVPLVMQPTSNKGKKALISPDKLKGLGLYRAPGGRQHMNDATAHALHYIVTKMRRADYLQALRPQ